MSEPPFIYDASFNTTPFDSLCYFQGAYINVPSASQNGITLWPSFNITCTSQIDLFNISNNYYTYDISCSPSVYTSEANLSTASTYCSVSYGTSGFALIVPILPNMQPVNLFDDNYNLIPNSVLGDISANFSDFSGNSYDCSFILTSNFEIQSLCDSSSNDTWLMINNVLYLSSNGYDASYNFTQYLRQILFFANNAFSYVPNTFNNFLNTINLLNDNITGLNGTSISCSSDISLNIVSSQYYALAPGYASPSISDPSGNPAGQYPATSLFINNNVPFSCTYEGQDFNLVLYDYSYNLFYVNPEEDVSNNFVPQISLPNISIVQSPYIFDFSGSIIYLYFVPNLSNPNFPTTWAGLTSNLTILDDSTGDIIDTFDIIMDISGSEFTSNSPFLYTDASNVFTSNQITCSGTQTLLAQIQSTTDPSNIITTTLTMDASCILTLYTESGEDISFNTTSPVAPYNIYNCNIPTATFNYSITVPGSEPLYSPYLLIAENINCNFVDISINNGSINVFPCTIPLSPIDSGFNIVINGTAYFITLNISPTLIFSLEPNLISENNAWVNLSCSVIVNEIYQLYETSYTLNMPIVSTLYNPTSPAFQYTEGGIIGFQNNLLLAGSNYNNVTYGFYNGSDYLNLNTNLYSIIDISCNISYTSIEPFVLSYNTPTIGQYNPSSVTINNLVCYWAIYSGDVGTSTDLLKTFSFNLLSQDISINIVDNQFLYSVQLPDSEIFYETNFGDIEQLDASFNLQNNILYFTLNPSTLPPAMETDDSNTINWEITSPAWCTLSSNTTIQTVTFDISGQPVQTSSSEIIYSSITTSGSSYDISDNPFYTDNSNNITFENIVTCYSSTQGISSDIILSDASAIVQLVTTAPSSYALSISAPTSNNLPFPYLTNSILVSDFSMVLVFENTSNSQTQELNIYAENTSLPLNETSLLTDAAGQIEDFDGYGISVYSVVINYSLINNPWFNIDCSYTIAYGENPYAFGNITIPIYSTTFIGPNPFLPSDGSGVVFTNIITFEQGASIYTINATGTISGCSDSLCCSAGVCYPESTGEFINYSLNALVTMNFDSSGVYQLSVSNPENPYYANSIDISSCTISLLYGSTTLVAPITLSPTNTNLYNYETGAYNQIVYYSNPTTGYTFTDPIDSSITLTAFFSNISLAFNLFPSSNNQWVTLNADVQLNNSTYNYSSSGSYNAPIVGSQIPAPVTITGNYIYTFGTINDVSYNNIYIFTSGSSNTFVWNAQSTSTINYIVLGGGGGGGGSGGGGVYYGGGGGGGQLIISSFVPTSNQTYTISVGNGGNAGTNGNGEGGEGGGGGYSAISVIDISAAGGGGGYGATSFFGGNGGNSGNNNSGGEGIGVYGGGGGGCYGIGNNATNSEPGTGGSGAIITIPTFLNIMFGQGGTGGNSGSTGSANSGNGGGGGKNGGSGVVVFYFNYS